MQLDGCRISAEQYEALLEGVAEPQAPSSAAISPFVVDPARDIAEDQLVNSSCEHVDLSLIHI